MATAIMLRHEGTGLTKTGYVGFSWTTLFFGMFPALFRSDFITFIGAFAILVILGIFSFGFGSLLAMFIWAFVYNRFYTSRLIERGYRIVGDDYASLKARQVLGIVEPGAPSARIEPSFGPR